MPDAASLKLAFQFHAAGQLAQAEARYRELLAADPDNAEALHLLGMLAHQTGRADEAIALLRRAVALAPAAAVYRCNLAGMLGKVGDNEAAAEQAHEALRLRPDFPEAHNNLGVALESLGRPAEAAAEFRQAIRLRPGYAEAFHHLGNAMRKLGRPDDAVTGHRQAIRLRPDYAAAWGGLATALAEQGRLEEMLAAIRREAELGPDSAASHSSLLYALHYDPAYGPERLFAEHQQWDRRHGDPLRQHIRPHDNDRDPRRRLRIGYVSPDFRNHTVPRFFEPALAFRDRDRFEVYCYSDVTRPDAVTQRLRGLADCWRETARVSHDVLAEQVRRDRIDILVDLRGHGSDNRLPVFARRPAPVQVTMVGYFDTTGLSAMDYRITDAVQDPPGESDRFHTEKLERLPRTCWCYRPDDDAPEVTPPPLERNGRVTFGCLNKVIKVTPELATLWARILANVPHSRLLLPVAGADEGGAVRSLLARHGLPPGRVDTPPKAAARPEYLSRYGQVDVALDTFPFNGITTTCDGLWMGVPAVTLSGATSVSRAGASILEAAGLGELVARTGEQYVTIATELAADADRLRELRAGMRERVSGGALADGHGHAAALGAAYGRMWDTYCQG